MITFSDDLKYVNAGTLLNAEGIETGMALLGGGGEGAPFPPQCSSKNVASWSKNKKSLGQKLDLVYLYIKDFSNFKRIKK